MCHCSAAAFDKYTFYANLGISVSSYHHNSVSSTAALLPSWRQQQQKKIDQPFSIRLFFATTFFCPDWTFVTSSKKRHRRRQGGANSNCSVLLSASIHILQSVSFIFRKAHLHLLILFPLVPLSQINMEQQQQQSLKNRDRAS